MTVLGFCGRQLGVLVIWRAILVGEWFVGEELKDKSDLGNLPVGREPCHLIRIGVEVNPARTFHVITLRARWWYTILVVTRHPRQYVGNMEVATHFNLRQTPQGAPWPPLVRPVTVLCGCDEVLQILRFVLP